MAALESLERELDKLHRQVPHLPQGFRDWLADNVWWLVIIGVVLGILGILTALPMLLVGAAVVTLFSPIAGGSVALAGLISIIVMMIIVAIEIRAIQPLKQREASGWDLLFLAAVISIIGSLISDVVTGNIFSGVIMTAIGAAIGFYLLFEIRGGFKKPADTKPKRTVATKK